MRRGIARILALGVLATQRTTPRSQLAGDLLQESAVLQAMASSLMENTTALRSEQSTAPSRAGALGLLQGSGLRAAPTAAPGNSTGQPDARANAVLGNANRAAREAAGESTALDHMEKMMMGVDYDAYEKVMGLFGVNVSAQAQHMRDLQAKQLKIEARDRNISNHFRTLNRQRVAQSGNFSGVNINLTAETCEDNRLWRTYMDRNYTLATGYVTLAGEAFDCASFANQGLCVDPGWFGRTEGPCVPNRNKYFMGENFSFPEKNCCACGKQVAASMVCTGIPYHQYGGALGVTVFAALLALSF